ALATKQDENTIAKHQTRRAALLLDPMGNFWTTAHLVRSDGPDKVKKQWASLDGWGCKPEDVNVAIWMPAGFRTANDPPGIADFGRGFSDLDDDDLADLIGINLMKDAQGAALAEAYAAVTEDGWNNDAGRLPAEPNYSFTHLINYLEYVRSSQGGGDH